MSLLEVRPARSRPAGAAVIDLSQARQAAQAAVPPAAPVHLAPPRIAPTAPLLPAKEPELSGARHLAKALLDRSAAALTLLALAPLLVTIAVGIRLTSPGPCAAEQPRAQVDADLGPEVVQAALDQLQEAGLLSLDAPLSVDVVGRV